MEFEKDIEKVLSGLRDVTIPRGMERRIVRRLEDEMLRRTVLGTAFCNHCRRKDERVTSHDG
jgi:hypothetical protein